jgi:hypothetical protein
MATSHYCNGKWRSGTVASCTRHRRLDKKQATVYDRSVESSSPPSSPTSDTAAHSSSSDKT